MKLKTPRKPLLVAAGLALFAAASVGNVYATEPAYVLDDDGAYIKTGTGNCLLTPRWTPELASRECHPQIIAAREKKAEEMKRAEIAALEKAKPITKTPQMVLKEIRLDATALFEFDAATLSTEGMAKLDQLANQVNAIRDVSNVVIEGHTDPIGSESYNETLSRKRAESVSSYLVSKGGIPNDKIQISAQGESQLLQSCENTRGKALISCLQPNRRVEVKVMGMEERPAQ